MHFLERNLQETSIVMKGPASSDLCFIDSQHFLLELKPTRNEHLGMVKYSDRGSVWTGSFRHDGAVLVL